MRPVGTLVGNLREKLESHYSAIAGAGLIGIGVGVLPLPVHPGGIVWITFIAYAAGIVTWVSAIVFRFEGGLANFAITTSGTRLANMAGRYFVMLLMALPAVTLLIWIVDAVRGTSQ